MNIVPFYSTEILNSMHSNSFDMDNHQAFP